MSINPADLPDEPKTQMPAPPHHLEREFVYFILANHKILMESVAKMEEEDRASLEEGEFFYQQTYHRDLRSVACSLAIVAIVTRLEHWVGAFCEKLKIMSSKQGSGQAGYKSKIIGRMKALNATLGHEFIPIDFFVGIVTVRDSVIHGGSKEEWQFQGLRKVEQQYADIFGNLEIEEWQVDEAADKTLKQLIWYEDAIKKLKSP
jgi:hypothetical protein